VFKRLDAKGPAFRCIAKDRAARFQAQTLAYQHSAPIYVEDLAGNKSRMLRT
jgi:hypothetical protein